MAAAIDEETWGRILSEPNAAPESRLFRHLPSDPRCKLCAAPYRAPFGPIMRVIGYGALAKNPQLCNRCFSALSKSPGGAEVQLTVLFADVRGSTAMAEQVSAGTFSNLLADFYRLVTDAVQAENGLIDKFLGDGVMALFIPAFTDGNHARRGLAAARRIQDEAHLPVGVGVNTGSAFTGFIGPTSEVTSFSAVGDAVNVAHRLGDAAKAGELLISAETAAQAGLETDRAKDAWSMRTLPVKGREEPVQIWSRLAASA
ncbi:MAG: adenylate/guanylate cyclase domain-containing protein [Chloroflexota bacterium]